MKRTVLLPGTLCDERAFGTLPDALAAPIILDYSAFSDAGAAAEAMVGEVGPGTLGIGFSLGGWVLLEMLRRAPTRFAGIVLISGNAHPDSPENASARKARVAFARENGFASLFAQDWPLMLGEPHRHDRHIRATIIAMAEATGHEAHGRQAEINSSRPDHRALALAPPVPLHVIAGAQDGLCPPERYAMASAAPGSSLTIVENAGHYLPLEAPDVVKSAILSRFPEHSA